MFSRLALASPLIAALVWAMALAGDPAPLDGAGALLAGGGLLITATVGVVGMVLSGGRWARLLSLGVVGGGYLLALLRSTDALWWGALALTSLAAALLFLPVVTRNIRKLPSAAGPPPRATLVPILLLAVPFALGIASLGETRPLAILVALAALVIAFWYARVLPGGLLAVRIVWPLLALVVAWPLGLFVGGVVVLTAAATTVLAWTRDAGVAFHPPHERGTAVPIPPELAPREVLEAAELDDRGRPKS